MASIQVAHRTFWFDRGRTTIGDANAVSINASRAVEGGYVVKVSVITIGNRNGMDGNDTSRSSLGFTRLDALAASRSAFRLRHRLASW